MQTQKDPKKIFYATGRGLILAFYLLAVLAPIYWLLITSLKTRGDIYTLHIQYWPRHFTLDNFRQLWNNTQFPVYLKNSIVIAVIASFVVLALSVSGGYALARYKFKGKQLSLIMFLLSQMIPGTLLIIPLFLIFSKLNLINQMGSLIIFYVVINVPFCLITMRSFFERIPVVLEEAAYIDGCSKLQTLWRVILPVMLPGIVATFVFAFTGAWNELLGAVMFVNSESLKTIPAGLSAFVSKYDVNWGQMTAGGVIALIPTVILFTFVQRFIVEGLTSGAVKE